MHLAAISEELAVLRLLGSGLVLDMQRGLRFSEPIQGASDPARWHGVGMAAHRTKGGRD